MVWSYIYVILEEAEKQKTLQCELFHHIIIIITIIIITLSSVLSFSMQVASLARLEGSSSSQSWNWLSLSLSSIILIHNDPYHDPISIMILIKILIHQDHLSIMILIHPSRSLSVHHDPYPLWSLSNIDHHNDWETNEMVRLEIQHLWWKMIFFIGNHQS